MQKKQIVILVAAVVAVVFSLYSALKPAPVYEDEKQVEVEASLMKRAQDISLELRKMADQRSLWKLERCVVQGCEDYVKESAYSMRQISKKGWKIEKMTNSQAHPDIYTCYVVNEEGQKGIMLLLSPDQGRHWRFIQFKTA